MNDLIVSSLVNMVIGSYLRDNVYHSHGFVGYNVLPRTQLGNIIGLDWLVTFALLATAILALIAIDKIVLKLMKQR